MKLSQRSVNWFDPFLAAVLLIAAEVELLGRAHNGPLAVEVVVVAGLTAPLAWRRRAPLEVACVVMAMLIVLKAIDGDFHQLTVPLFAVFVPPFSVAAYETRRRALLGLAVCVIGPCVLNAMGSGSGSLAFAIAMPGASWATGRLMRARGILAAELRSRSKRIAVEREDRERLAVADERSRIARELHAVVATTVSAMVVQTDAAQRLLDVDPARADDAMASIEEAGRKTLGEMRRVLGVLRDEHEPAELSPQPGVGQIHALIEAARERLPVELHLEGEPGSLPASVNLGLYRILEDALTRAGADSTQPTDVALRFGEHVVELTVTSAGVVPLGWPTLAMRERVALCEGEIEVEATPGAGGRLLVRLPRSFAGALA
jgi:signal transduction histidine kinase